MRLSDTTTEELLKELIDHDPDQALECLVGWLGVQSFVEAVVEVVGVTDLLEALVVYCDSDTHAAGSGARWKGLADHLDEATAGWLDNGAEA